MIEPITYERWQEAQVAERKAHTFDKKEGLRRYRMTYENYFKFLGINPKVHKLIAEIGSADFPALYFCEPFQGYVIEPMPSEILEELCEKKSLILITIPFEGLIEMKFDEIWIFNVLQHVIDPEKIISKAKSFAKIIRFFEPIDYPTCDYHPHTFSEADFHRWFGSCVKVYDDRMECFFDGKCCYGVWTKPELQ